MAAVATAPAAGGSKPAPKANKGGKSNEEVFAGFQTLRAEQRQLANKISELEMDLNEHKIVADTLKGVEGSRRCFRMVGGVLVERKVEDILPELEANRELLPKALAALNEQLIKKGTEINDYIDKYDIRVQKSAPPEPSPASEAAGADTNKTNVLVASS